MSNYESEVAQAIETSIGSQYDVPHPKHGEELTVTGGLFAIATALNRLADAIEAQS